MEQCSVDINRLEGYTMRDRIIQLFAESSADSQRKFRLQQELARIDLELSKAKESYRRKRAMLAKKKDDLRRSLDSMD